MIVFPIIGLAASAWLVAISAPGDFTFVWGICWLVICGATLIREVTR